MGTDRLVVSFGAGTNSVAVCVGFAERGICPDAIVFADTRGEKPKTEAYLRDAFLPWLRRQNLPPLTTVSRAEFAGRRRLRTGDQSLEDECLRLGSMPSRAYGYSTCADKWKLDPFKWWCREQWPEDFIMRVIGFHAEEAHRVDEVQDKGFGKTYPLIAWGWDQERCEAEIVRAGLPVPPKSACYYCPSSTKTEVLALAKEEPLLFHRALKMEQAALANGKSRIAGLGRHWSWKNLVDADETTRDQMPEAPVEAYTTCHLSA